MKTEKKVTVDFSGLTATDLNGKQYAMPDANKDIGNALFVCSRSIEIDTLARSLHSGKKTEASREELEVIKQAVDTALAYLPIAIREIHNHIDKLLTEASTLTR